ncbi:MAG: hypothetical protein EXR92_02135 [Gemmatimonadetes bacterium]|nr:hypothetical protein [Gemmatimonadota bacterium]
MSLRTNPDRILEHIDRQRSRDDEGRDEYTRDASARELGTEVPLGDATPAERLRRIFGLIEKAYMSTASGPEIRRLAQRFQTVGDISSHHARGDVSVAVSYLDHERSDDVGLCPFEILPARLDETRKVSKTSSPDANALRILRADLRTGVMVAYKKMEPRLRDAVRERADLGHVAVRITMDLRPGR